MRSSSQVAKKARQSEDGRYWGPCLVCQRDAPWVAFAIVDQTAVTGVCEECQRAAMQEREANAQREAVRNFELAYAERSALSVEDLHRMGRWGAPCDCGEEGCEGFQMLHEPEDEYDFADLARRGLLDWIGAE